MQLPLHAPAWDVWGLGGRPLLMHCACNCHEIMQLCASSGMDSRTTCRRRTDGKPGADGKPGLRP